MSFKKRLYIYVILSFISMGICGRGDKKAFKDNRSANESGA